MPPRRMWPNQWRQLKAMTSGSRNLLQAGCTVCGARRIFVEHRTQSHRVERVLPIVVHTGLRASTWKRTRLVFDDLHAQGLANAYMPCFGLRQHFIQTVRQKLPDQQRLLDSIETRHATLVHDVLLVSSSVAILNMSIASPHQS